MLSLPSLYFDYLIINAPVTASFLPLDRLQYFEGSGAGYGLEESAQFIKSIAARYPKVIILRESDDFRNVTKEFYLSDIERVFFIDVPNFYTLTPQRLDNYAQEGPTISIITSSSTHIGSKSDLFNGAKYPQVWRLVSFPKPGGRRKVEIYQWLQPADFAIRWFQQGGDKEPVVAWQASDTLVTASGGILLDWSQTTFAAMDTLQGSSEMANVEYVLATPELINRYHHLFAPFISTDATRLKLNKFPPGWRLAFVYPDKNCQWCLFQLRAPNQLTQIVFDEKIELKRYDISITRQPSDESIHITLYWKSLKPLSAPYSVFIHLLDSHGRRVGQVDEPLLQGKWSADDWEIGNKLVDRHTLVVGPKLQSDRYTILIGLYNPTDLMRLSAYSSQHLIIDDAVTLTTLSIEEKF